MVNKLLGYLLILLLPLSLQADFANSDIFITSGIDEYGSYANQPLKGTITVTHDQNNAVDNNSFLLDNKPIKVEFVRDVKISSNSPLVISYYQFQLPAQPAGLYMLPEAAVKIAGKQYRSIMSSYEVKGGSAPAPAEPSSGTSSPTQSRQAAKPTDSSTATTPAPPATIILKLEANAGSDKPLYPGQKAKFTYRYFYNTNISLTKEVLPLLEAEGFLKFGDKEVKDYTENNMSVREISQTVEAIKPGTFSFGPSIIEGYAYTQTAKGQPSYSSSKLMSEVPKLTVTVLPFSDKDKPSSFNGAMGDFDFMTTLASSADINIGDEIKLNVDISSKGDVKEVPLPDINKQPGFNGFFRMSDLPPVGSVEADTKHFVVSMRPLVEVKEIPSIAFSFLNPATGEYKTLHSMPIPINVKAAKEGTAKAALPAKAEEAPVVPQKSAPEVLKPPSPATKPIEIQGNLNLQTADLYNKIFGTWLALGIIPFALALLFYQITLRDYLIRMKSEVKPDTSQDTYTEFLQQKKGSSRYYELLNKSLKLKLAEIGKIKKADVLTENLNSNGISGEVRAFLSEIEEKRFSGTGKLIPQDLEARAQALMDDMDKEGITS